MARQTRAISSPESVREPGSFLIWRSSLALIPTSALRCDQLAPHSPFQHLLGVDQDALGDAGPHAVRASPAG